MHTRNSSKPRFLFVGRLSQEKGFDRIIILAKYLLDSPNKGYLDICGDGEMLSELIAALSEREGFLDRSSRNSSLVQRDNTLMEPVVTYHGRVNKDNLAQILNNSNYCVMPSRFLETFGLSALESIERGVPVIGPAKGGLQQFLLSHHTVSDVLNDAHTTRNFLVKCQEIIDTYSYEYWKSESAAVINISNRYTSDTWIKVFLSGVFDIKEGGEGGVAKKMKVLLLSDFSAPIGGIESHVISAQKLLTSIGWNCSLLTALAGDKKIVRILSFFLAHCNIIFACRLQRKLKKYKPDIIWLHSVNRAIGPVGLYPLKHTNAKIIATYHDLGFTTPFPSRVYHESDVPEFDIKSFFHAGFKLSGYFGGIASVMKYIFLCIQKPYFNRVRTHFVPSEFLVKYVAYQFGEDKKIVVLPHCSELTRS